ncbi:MAG: TonB-dependent receptor [Vicinamibacterales bacterium]
MRLKAFVALAAFVGCLSVPGLVRAQATTGTIAGVARDTTGAVLPGVTVEAASPALIEKVRVATTDGSGNYKIIDLRPGVYSVTFTLPGFSSVKRAGIELSGGFSASVNADLAVGSVEETITVTGATPIVDVQSVRTQTVLRAEVMDALPSGQRDLSQLASLTLGAVSATAGRNDVGGDKSEQATSVAIHGSRSDDARILYDGMNANNPGGALGGQSRLYKINTVMVAEQVIDTSGNTAESLTSGANVNMVPKEGANTFSLYGMANYTSKDLASGKVPDDLVARGSRPDQNSMKQVWDYGVGIGGPVRKDKAWFYGGARWWGSQAYAADNYFNKATNFYTYVPDLNRPVYVNIQQPDYGGRLTWQMTSKQKLSLEQHYERGVAHWQGIGATTAPEATISFDYRPIHFSQGTYSYPRTNRLLMQAGVSYLRQAVQFLSVGGADVPGRIRIADTNYPGVGSYAWGGIAGGSRSDNGDPQQADNLAYRTAVSYVTGSHALKMGLEGVWGMFNTRGNQPGGINLNFLAGVPQSVVQFATPFRSDGRVVNLGLYVSDQWTLKRLTLTAGARYDNASASALAVDVPAGEFIGARSYPKTSNLPNYKDITPRVGAAYDLFGNGKTAVRASWGRYLVGVGGGQLSALSPANAVLPSATRPWNDANGNFTPDCDLTNFGANGECGVFNVAGFGSPRVALSWDEGARKGWGIREYNYQWSVGLQHELRPGLGVSAGYYRTSFGNMQMQMNTALTAGSYNTYCMNAPTDARLGESSGQQVCGIPDLTFAAKTIPQSIVQYRVADAPIPGLTGKPTDVFNGADFAMNWRFKGSGLVSGGVTLGKSVRDFCFANNFPQIINIATTAVGSGQIALGPRDANYCTDAAQPLWNGVGSQVKFQFVYPLPGAIMLAATYKHLPGIPVTGTVTYSNAAVAPVLGRNLAACTAPTGACTQAAAVNVVRPGTLYDDRLNQIDLRGTRRFRIGKARLQGILELYNVLNVRTPQANTVTWGVVGAAGAQSPGATYLRPSSFLGGRLFKFGAQIDF